jgi:hypothetical protein
MKYVKREYWRALQNAICFYTLHSEFVIDVQVNDRFCYIFKWHV